MFYTIYETTCILNGKKYIGKHQTENPYDDYIGSGLMLSNAIKKYGKENFIKTVLFVFDNEEDMNKKEAELIDIRVINDDQYYNIALGGYGGAIVLKEGHPLYEKTCKKLSESHKARAKQISETVKQLHIEKRVGMHGKKQSDHQKKAVSEALKGKKKTEEHKRNHRESLMKRFSDPNYVHPNKGIKKTPEQLEEMRMITLNRPKKICPHCNKEMDERNYARYHGDNCKLKHKDLLEEKYENYKKSH